jgi:hypothetical protein
MDESALRSTLASLADCGSSLHWWLRFWTWWVVIGVSVEIVFVFWEYVEDLHDCKRSLLRPPTRPNLPLFVLGFLGAGLVAIGVAKELNVESKIAIVETCVRKGNDQLSLLLSNEAGHAATSARNAREEAEHAKAEADDASAQAEALSKYLAIVANSINGRHLDFVKFRKLMKGQPKAVVIIRYEQDGEAETLATQLNFAFGPQGLGWQTTVLAFPIVSVVGGSPRNDFQSLAASSGLAYAAKTIPIDLNSPLQVLIESVNLSLGGWGNGSAMLVEDPTLPENTFVIGVGRHIINAPIFIPPKLRTQKSKPKH